jgi:hypothetical protein
MIRRQPRTRYFRHSTFLNSQLSQKPSLSDDCTPSNRDVQEIEKKFDRIDAAAVESPCDK